MQRQLRAADLLVLNKCDLVTAGDLQALRCWLDAIVPGTPRFETEQAHLPPALLGAPLHESVRLSTSGHPSGLSAPASHGHDFDTWALRDTPVFSAPALRALLKAMPPGVLRLKGLVRTDEHELAEMQFAGRHGSLRTAPQGVHAARLQGTLVAIGARGRLPRTALDDAFARARAPQAPDSTS